MEQPTKTALDVAIERIASLRNDSLDLSAHIQSAIDRLQGELDRLTVQADQFALSKGDDDKGLERPVFGL